MKFPNIGKYRIIVVSVALFVLLDAAVLVLNFYTSYEIERDAHAIQVVSRQTVLSQTILSQLYQTQDALSSGADYQHKVDALADSFKTFDETLDSMIYGGELIGKGQGGDSLFVNPEYSTAAQSLLGKAEALWKDYRTLIQPVVYSDFNGLSREDLQAQTQAAINFGSKVNKDLLQALREVSSTTEQIAQYKAVRLRWVQVVGISLAVVNFLIILFHFIRKLGESDRKADRARKEIDDILGTVKEGLLLLDPELRIGSQHSNSLVSLLNTRLLEDQSFVDILRPMVTDKTMDMLKDYVSILFNPEVSHSLVANLNPLDQIEVAVDNNDGTLTTKYLAFEFCRVEERGVISHLLVTINDVTERVNLRLELEATQARTSREMEMLLTVLNADRQLILPLVGNFRDGLNEINQILCKQARKTEELKLKLKEIARIVHRLKGDCSAVGLTHYASRLHAFEDKVCALQQRDELGGNDFLTLTVILNNLIRDWSVLESIIDKLSNLGGLAEAAGALPKATKFLDQHQSELNQWEAMLHKLNHEVSSYFQKKVELDMRHLDLSAIPVELKETAKTFIIQSLRNSIAHGIEKPEQRVLHGKSEAGVIKIYAQRRGDQVHVGVRDDGGGLDLARIVQLAKQRGMLPHQINQPLDKGILMDLLFSSGFSTAHEVSTHAGRGVGLDLLRSMIKKVGGKIDVGSQSKLFTEFRATLPISAELAEPAIA